jgi:hypothetical protein
MNSIQGYKMRFSDCIFSGLFALLLIISGCGNDSQQAQQADYEEALFFSYATTKPLEYMNDIAINDLVGVVNTLQTIVMQYISETGNLPTSVDLSNPPDDMKPYIPPGMTGTISTDITQPQPKVTAHLTLKACLDVTKTKEYTGTFNAEGDFSLDVMKFIHLNINAPSLTIAYTGKSYAKAVYSSLTIGIDYTTDSYTLTGSISVDDKGYSYTSLLYKQTSSTALTISGTFTIGGMEFKISGSPTLDLAGVWTSGTVTLTNADATATVALNGTTASFTLDDGTKWEKDDWYLDRLVP